MKTLRISLLILALLVVLGSSIDAASYTTKTTTIANGGTESAEVNMRGGTLVLIELPAAFTGVALTFQCASESGGTFKDVYSNGTQVSLTVAQGRMESTSTVAGSLAACRYLKIVSGGAEGGDRTIVLIIKG